MDTTSEKRAAPGLKGVEQRFLLDLARSAVAATVTQAPLDLHSWSTRLPSEQLRRPAGAFVTLHHEGDLRGCVGSLKPRKPLYLTVAHCAIAAATRDPRFAPIAEPELAQLRIEISVLSPLFPIQPEELKPGEHGLVVTQGFFQGALLPRVASDHGWDRERLLEETCGKAGLERDAWKKGARLEAFTAFVFSDE